MVAFAEQALSVFHASDFADDVASISGNNDSPKQATTTLANANEARGVGLRLNPDKSKVMRIWKTDMNVDVNIEASKLETAQKLTSSHHTGNNKTVVSARFRFNEVFDRLNILEVPRHALRM